MAMPDIEIKVIYAASPHQISEVMVLVPEGASVQAAILASGLLDDYPELTLETCKVGRFSKRCKLEDKVALGDRIEIYRPLLIDPKEARRARVKQRK